MTPDTSGRLFEMPWATWDPDSSCWRTSGAISASASTEFSGTWPTSGLMRSGGCFEHPTWEHPISGPDCSALLGTPNAHPRTHTPRGVDHGVQLANQINALLPTPTSSHPGGGSLEDYHGRLNDLGRGANFAPLNMLVEQLLPTPQARDGSHGGAQGKRYLNPERSNDLDDAVDALTKGMLLPTVNDSRGGRNITAKRKPGGSPVALRCLGNAVVPQVAEAFGRMLAPQEVAA